VVQELLAANVERSFGTLSEEDWAKARFCKYAIETQALFHRISSPALPPPYAAPSAGEAAHVWDQEWKDPEWQLTDANWHATALLAADLARYYHHHALHDHPHHHHPHAPSSASVSQPPPGLLEEAWVDLTRHLRRDLPLGYVHRRRRRRRHQPPPQ
jgi:hypothetical protein